MRPALSLLFTPHLAPLKRGMCVTTVVELAKTPARRWPGQHPGHLREVLRRTAFHQPDRQPHSPDPRRVGLEQVRHRAGAGKASMLMLFSAIDNLVKGASGQAVQNMNIRFGLEEAAGLPRRGAVAVSASTIVVKIGGRAAERTRACAAWRRRWQRCSPGHGSCWCTAAARRSRPSRSGSASRRRSRDGVRQTSAAEMDIVDMVLAGKVNKPHRAAAAHPRPGRGGPQRLGRRDLHGPADRPADQRTAEVAGHRHPPARAAARRTGSCPCCRRSRLDSEGRGLNINADTVAFALAARLGASALVFLSDIPGHPARRLGDPRAVGGRCAGGLSTRASSRAA